MNNSIAFYLMTEKGLAVLDSHIRTFGTKHIAGVITASDANVVEDHSIQIKELCKKNGIPCFDRKEKNAIEASHAFVVSWRWMLAENKGLIIFHDSLLPRYRGYAPLVNMLVNGEKRIGVTALFAGKEFDTGDIIAQKSATIAYPITIAQAIARIGPLYSALAEEIAAKIIAGKKISGKKQNEKLASYSLWRDEEDYTIDWNKTAAEIKRHIDATGNPYKGASSSVEGKKVHVLAAEIVKDVKIENRTPGKMIFLQSGSPVVACKKGLLKITSLKDDDGKDLLPLTKFRTRFC